MFQLISNETHIIWFPHNDVMKAHCKLGQDPFILLWSLLQKGSYGQRVQHSRLQIVARNLQSINGQLTEVAEKRVIHKIMNSRGRIDRNKWCEVGQSPGIGFVCQQHGNSPPAPVIIFRNEQCRCSG